ncbi:MAG: hypothetical protein WDA16_06615 [Candidatus Thermoplasmatota archaeon]
MSDAEAAGRPRRRGMSLLAPLVFILTAAVLAQAAGSMVHTTTLASVYVERLQVPSYFFVAETITEQTQANVYAQGLEEDPVAMSETASVPLAGTVSTAIANTALVTDHWTYTVLLQETGPDKALPGNYSVSLEVSGVDLGTVYLVKIRHVDAIITPLIGKTPVPAVDDPVVPVGARVTFDLGRDRPAAPTFILRVSYLDMLTYHLKSTQDVNSGAFYWVGVGGDIDGVTDPKLSGHVGEAMRIIITQGDGQAPHNLLIKKDKDTDDKDAIAGPTADISNLGDEQSLVWTPSAVGAFLYACAYHHPTQDGPAVVTS